MEREPIRLRGYLIIEAQEAEFMALEDLAEKILDLERMLNDVIDERERIKTAYHDMCDASLRHREERDAARENFQGCVKERDKAILQICAACAYIDRAVRLMEITIPAARELRKALGICDKCGPTGRLADAPCTHKGPSE